jgi:peptide/nickel transport system substrate-binding protein
MADQYERVGIRTEIREFSDRPAYAEMVRAKQLDDACCFDSSPLSTYRLLQEKFHSVAGGPWWLGYTDHSVDDLINRAKATVDVKMRGDFYRSAYAKISSSAPWIFLYNPTLMWGIGSNADGWIPQVDGLIRII